MVRAMHIDARIPAGLTPKRAAVLARALSQVGTREKSGRNDGPVEKYMPAWAHGKNLPYCAWFVNWCFYQEINAYPYVRNMGAVYELFRAGQKLQEHLELDAQWPALSPQPGD